MSGFLIELFNWNQGRRVWGIVHKLIKPESPEAAESECSCGWRGHVAEFPEHVVGVAKESRDRIVEFVDFVDEEIGAGTWGEIDRFSRDQDFLTPAAFVNAMHNLGFKRILP
jgi:hypothetical protein